MCDPRTIDSTDDTFHCGFDTVDRQLQSSCEIVARPRGHDAQRLATAAHGVRSKCDHAVATDHYEIVVLVRAFTRLVQGIVETRAGDVDDVEVMGTAGFLQQTQYLRVHLSATAFIGSGVAHHGHHATALVAFTLAHALTLAKGPEARQSIGALRSIIVIIVSFRTTHRSGPSHPLHG